jgi:DNA invertase Pin-like site-specific DNA recombinase
VEQYCQSNGAKVIAAYTEVETGKGRNPKRPELLKAIAHAKAANATLMVAKLDRLSRNVAFLANLIESKVDFVACDQPHATTFTLHILAAVAEHEAKMISERTKAALAARKARGLPLGADMAKCRNLTHEARIKGSKAARTVWGEQTDLWYRERGIDTRIAALRAEGKTLQAIANQLNTEGIQTRHGKVWTKMGVKNCLERFGNEQSSIL